MRRLNRRTNRSRRNERWGLPAGKPGCGSRGGERELEGGKGGNEFECLH